VLWGDYFSKKRLIWELKETSRHNIGEGKISLFEGNSGPSLFTGSSLNKRKENEFKKCWGLKEKGGKILMGENQP